MQKRDDGALRQSHEFFADQDDAHFELRAQPAAVVRGRLVDRDARPLGGVQVRIQEPADDGSGWRLFGFADTDRDGRFEFGGLLAPKARVRVIAGRLGGSATREFGIEPGATVADLSLVAPAFGSLAGRVLDPSGRPVAGARVMLRPEDPATGRRIHGVAPSALTDRLGRYGLRDVEPGAYRAIVDVGFEEHAEGTAHSERLAVGPGQSVAVDLTTSLR